MASSHASRAIRPPGPAEIPDEFNTDRSRVRRSGAMTTEGKAESDWQIGCRAGGAVEGAEAVWHPASMPES